MRTLAGFFLIFCLLYPQVGLSNTAGIEKILNIEVKKLDPVCKACRLTIQTRKSSWIKNSILYRISTFDIFPPPVWHAVLKDDRVLFLDRRRVDDWNQVIQDEAVRLEKKDAVSYAKFFLRMTMSQSEFIDKLTPGELRIIATKTKKKVQRSSKITLTSEKIQIVFYARDLQGELQEWNMIFKKKR